MPVCFLHSVFGGTLISPPCVTVEDGSGLVLIWAISAVDIMSGPVHVGEEIIQSRRASCRPAVPWVLTVTALCCAAPLWKQTQITNSDPLTPEFSLSLFLGLLNHHLLRCPTSSDLLVPKCRMTQTCNWITWNDEERRANPSHAASEIFLSLFLSLTISLPVIATQTFSDAYTLPRSILCFPLLRHRCLAYVVNHRPSCASCDLRDHKMILCVTYLIENR